MPHPVSRNGVDVPAKLAAAASNGWRLAAAAAVAVILVISCLWSIGSSDVRAERLAFSEMYQGASSLGIQLSEKMKNLHGKQVRMTGFMAPPLKPTLAFFVLTSVPMAICPFCSTDADWPMDIVMVKLAKPVTALPFDRPIWVEGILELGTEMDEETGFVSLVRLRADTFGEAHDSVQ